MDARGATSAQELAARIADAIWWNYCSPLGYVVERSTLKDVVRHLARRLKVADRVDPDLPVWDQVAALTDALVSGDPGVRDTRCPSSTRRPGRTPLVLLAAPIGYILPGSPGAGETSTRSWVISSMRHVEAPSRNVSPTRLSKTISSSSSPTRARRPALRRQEHAVEPAVGNRAAVDDRDALGAFARGRAFRARGPT